jgi:hypothetical protein
MDGGKTLSVEGGNQETKSKCVQGLGNAKRARFRKCRAGLKDMQKGLFGSSDAGAENNFKIHGSGSKLDAKCDAKSIKIHEKGIKVGAKGDTKTIKK